MTHGHELKGGGCGWEGVCRTEGNKGGKWVNCNSIINKIYFKKEKKNFYQMRPLRERKATKIFEKIFAVHAIDKWLISGIL